jgi:hypothetical protein
MHTGGGRAYMWQKLVQNLQMGIHVCNSYMHLPRLNQQSWFLCTYGMAHNLYMVCTYSSIFVVPSLEYPIASHKHIREGSDVCSETKIFNLDSDEYSSNLTFKKETSGGNK